MGVDVMVDNASQASDVEKDRQRLIAEMDAEYGRDWLQLNAPGSFGCHEPLDRTTLSGDIVEKSLLSPPACIANAEWFVLATQAVESLRELYQRVGQSQLDPPV